MTNKTELKLIKTLTKTNKLIETESNAKTLTELTQKSRNAVLKHIFDQRIVHNNVNRLYDKFNELNNMILKKVA